MLPNNSLNFITINVKEMESSKKKLKLIQCFQDKIESTGFTVTVYPNKNEKRAVKVKFFFLTESQILVASELLTLERKRLPLKNNKWKKKVEF